MPKCKRGTAVNKAGRPWQCPSCPKSYAKRVGLSLHLYHNAHTCGFVAENNAKPPPDIRVPEINSSILIHSQSGGGGAIDDIEDDKSQATSIFHRRDDDDESFYDDDHAVVIGEDDNNPILQLSPGALIDLQEEGHGQSNSTEQRVHTELIQLLDKVEAPDYLFTNILDWACRAKSQNYSFSPKLTTRKAVINDLKRHFNLQNLNPTLTEVKLESVREKVTVVSFDFKSQLISMLTNSSLMRSENLVLNEAICHTQEDGTSFTDYSPWYLPYKSTVLDEVLSGRWYQDTVAIQARKSNDFFCPIILYVDKTFIDPMRSRFNLEPLNFTLAIFKRQCRSQFAFWRTLGYIPDHPASDDRNPKDGYKARNYHTMLRAVLSSLAQVQETFISLDNFHLRIDDVVKVVNLRVPVAFIIADTQGADKLCGRYLNYKESVSRLHRTCRCKPQDACDTKQICTWVTRNEMEDVILYAERLQEYSQHFILDHAFDTIDFGANPHGVYGGTPNDILHGLKAGIIPYVLEIFIQDDLNEAARHRLNSALKDTLPHLRQGGNDGFPRLYFPNGITTLTNLTAEEHVGILFTAYILSFTKQGRLAIHESDKMSPDRVKQFQNVFQKLLIFNAWMSNTTTGFWEINDAAAMRRASRKIGEMMDYIVSNFTRKSGQGWKISKMHELLHVCRFIDLYGAPSNFDSSPCERLHKDIAKKPGRTSQKRHETFTHQAAQRLTDRHVVDFAYRQLLLDQTHQSTGSKITNREFHSTKSGSKFVLEINKRIDSETYDVSIRGFGKLSHCELDKELYPDLVLFLVTRFVQFAQEQEKEDEIGNTLLCSTEFVDEAGIVYRAHPSYRGGRFWHDWAWVSYVNNMSEDGFDNVPAKILCFLPNGINGDDDDDCTMAVCHPCKWDNSMVSDVVRKWQLQSVPNSTCNGIPFDVVPASALCGHCLVVPDLVQEEGFVYQVIEPCHWTELL